MSRTHRGGLVDGVRDVVGEMVGVRLPAALVVQLGARGDFQETHSEAPVVSRAGVGLRSRL
eukprot:13093625-Alexandrium_andersonii.AAC.1